MDDAYAFWTTEIGTGKILAEALPPAAPDEVLIRALYSGISRGTETLVFRGDVPQSEWQRMRAPFQAGQFPAPVKYGYASVGRVETGPDRLIGRLVFCLHPHQDRYVVPREAVHLLPADVDPRRAVLAANLETAINGVWDAEIGIGDRVAVVGGGTVGCLAAWLAARVPGAKVELIDIDPGRAGIAAALDVSFATPDRATGGADRVIHASGSPEGLVTALGLAATEGTVVEMSWYGTRTVSLPLGAAFHSQRLTIRSSQVGAVPPARRPRWSHTRRLQLALDLLRDARLDALLTGEDPFAALPDVMARLASSSAGVLCHVIRYD